MNVKQKDGIASISDNVALGSMFGGIGGLFTNTFQWYIGVFLLGLAIVFFATAFNLRKDSEDNAC